MAGCASSCTSRWILRGGLLRWFTDQHLGPRDIWGRFAQQQGYGIVEDYVRGLDARFGAGTEVTLFVLSRSCMHQT